MTALRAYQSLWRAAAVQRDGGRHYLFSGTMLLVLGVIAATFTLAFTRGRADLVSLARVLLGVAACWLGLVWTVLFLPASMTMNSAANARLLPRQRRSLMRVAAAGWLLVSGALAAAAGDVRFGLIVGLLLLGFPLTFSGKPLAMAVIIGAGNAVWLVPTFLPPDVVALLAGPAGQAGEALALLAFAAFSLRWVYPDGGDAHLAVRARQVAQLARFAAHGVAQQADIGGGAGRVYLAALRRDIRRRDPARLLMHALGPVAHWSAWIAGAASILLLAAFARLALWWIAAPPMQAFVTGLTGFGLMSMVLSVGFSTAQYGQQLRTHGGEQALLRLTPLAGDAALLNRRLAGELLRRALCNWTLLTAVIVAATFLIGAGLDVALRQFALCCLAAQLSATGLLGDYAGKGGWHLGLAFQAALLGTLEGAVSVALGWWNGSAPWPWMIALALITGTLQVLLGWRRMLAAPVAFPAGRMA